jgi:hypothetical protein
VEVRRHDGIFIVPNHFENRARHTRRRSREHCRSISIESRLAPTTPAQRTWGFYNYTALWFSMCMEITTYQLASSLIAKGMDWKQAVGTVLLGNLIVLVPMLLNAHAGAKYGIPFPGVYSRAVRRARREYCGASACDCGLRLVRHSVVDRRNGDSLDA